jgi:hypothetical protein
MPHWESVFGHHFEVPGFVRFLVQKKILEDISWGNDASPSFGVWDPTSDRRVVLWVDHPIKQFRENVGERFYVQRDEDAFFSSEDLEEALETLFVELGKFYAEKAPKGPKEWRPANAGPRDVEAEWKEKLTDLLGDYYERR